MEPGTALDRDYKDLTWHRQIHFSTFDGKLTFQCIRNGPQNTPFCPGSLQDTFIIYSLISHQHNYQKKQMDIWKSKKRGSPTGAHFQVIQQHQVAIYINKRLPEAAAS